MKKANLIGVELVLKRVVHLLAEIQDLVGEKNHEVYVCIHV